MNEKRRNSVFTACSYEVLFQKDKQPEQHTQKEGKGDFMTLKYYLIAH